MLPQSLWVGVCAHQSWGRHCMHACACRTGPPGRQPAQQPPSLQPFTSLEFPKTASVAEGTGCQALYANNRNHLDLEWRLLGPVSLRVGTRTCVIRCHRAGRSLVQWWTDTAALVPFSANSVASAVLCCAAWRRRLSDWRISFPDQADGRPVSQILSGGWCLAVCHAWQEWPGGLGRTLPWPCRVALASIFFTCKMTY